VHIPGTGWCTATCLLPAATLPVQIVGMCSKIRVVGLQVLPQFLSNQQL
jgi:hypothetical protein